MNSQQREIIRVNIVNLINNLDCSEDFLSHFVSKRIFTLGMIEDLTRDIGQTRNRRFLTDVQKKGRVAFDILYDALVQTFQFEVADLLKPELAPSRERASEPVQETRPAGLGGEGGASGGAGGSGDPGSGGGGNIQPPGGSSREPIYEEVDRPPPTHTESRTPAEDSDSDLSDSLEYLDENQENLDRISLRLMPCRKPRIRELFNSDSVYRMTAPHRGRCLIINNRYFDQPPSASQVKLENRDGSEMDVRNISTVFKDLNFVCEVKTDLTSQEMLETIREETKNPGYAEVGVSALVIMTHGTENRLYGRDNQPIKYSDVFDLLSAYRFPAMAGKPKLVILQACSGERRDTMGHYTSDTVSTVSDAQVCNPSSQTKEKPQTVESPFPGDYLSTDDLYIMKASFLSFVSARHSRQGTWFIRAIVVALYKHSCHRDIQTIFKQVKKKVRDKSILANKMYGHVSGQQPTDECFFTGDRKLYLFPGFNP